MRDIDINDKDWAGRSAVFLAVRNHSYGALELLLRHGADTAGVVAHSDDAALHYAVKGGDVRIVNVSLGKIVQIHVVTIASEPKFMTFLIFGMFVRTFVGSVATSPRLPR